MDAILTDLTAHPTFVREQRQITAILAEMLVRRGRTEQEALKEAEQMLQPKAPQRAASTERLQARRAASR